MDDSLTISIYAAVVSTFVFLWRIFEFVYDKFPKIKIQVGQLIDENNHFCIVQITNQGKQKRYIERPEFIADKVFKENGTKFGHTGDLTFPLAIDNGEKIEFKFPYAVLTKYKNEYNINKIKAILKDTLGNKYKSKWTDI